MIEKCSGNFGDTLTYKIDVMFYLLIAQNSHLT